MITFKEFLEENKFKSTNKTSTFVKPFVRLKSFEQPKASKHIRHHLGITVPFGHMVKDAIRSVDLDNDGDVDRFDSTTPGEITGDEKKNMTKLMQQKMTGEVKHTKKGLAFENYFSTDISNKYNQIEKGSRVSFNHHSMDYDDIKQKIGTVVGSNTQHFRIRTDDGKLYLVRHKDITMLNEENLEELSSMTDRAVDAIHRHVIKGENLLDVVFNLITQTNVKLGTKELIKAYISKYGDPNEKEHVSSEHKAALIKKYGSR